MTLKLGGIGMISTTGYIARFSTELLTIKYVFPGGSVPSLPCTLELLDAYGLHVIDVEELGWHYQRTAEHWLGNFEMRWPEIQASIRNASPSASGVSGPITRPASSRASAPVAAILPCTTSPFTKGKDHYPKDRRFISMR